ncbi:MAG TPA: phosphate uptake regulator PhoU [Candidatus Acidoferrales bacterium]|nr:phosphate uptake regulator PhoU [Candidatus Acidoferrales bacterium]
MEIRKVQLTGKSTYTVSLPKTWANKVGLHEKAQVTLSPLPDGSMRVAPREQTKPQKRRTYKIDTFFGDTLARQIIAIYIAGYEIVELKAERISSEQRKVIRDMTYRLIGTEIVEETAKSVVIQDLLNPTELPVKKALRRIYLIVESMHMDAIKSLIRDDADLANDVIQRDGDVDRLYLLIVKRLKKMTESPYIEGSDISVEDGLEFYLAASSLERIADHAHKIAKCALMLSGNSIPDELFRDIEVANDMSNKIVGLAVDAFFKLDIALAEESIQRKSQQTEILDRLDKSIFRLEAQIAVLLGTVVDSMDRVGDYGVNIAEVALDLAIVKSL